MSAKILPHMRIQSPAQAETVRKEIAEGSYDLREHEIWWRERSQVLEEHGYQLRSRLRPGWVPSWQNKELNLHPYWCEDSIAGGTFKVIHAIRISDRKDVMLMVLWLGSREGKIYRHLTNPERLGADDHHIVPMLDSFQDERLPDYEFFVMPLLRKFLRPPFEVVTEVVDLFRQLLEGLVYMHEVGVAHRDCSQNNIMMDAPSIFPRGFHPSSVGRDRSGNDEVLSTPRYKAKGHVRYYFIDFGISRLYQPEEPHVVVGSDGTDREVPELSGSVAYDPFPADVFILGNVIQKTFLLEYQNFEFLSSLVNSMISKEPTDRPSAADALKQLESAAASQGFFKLRRRLRSTKEPGITFTRRMRENVTIMKDTALLSVRFAYGASTATFRSMRSAVASRLPPLRTKTN